jgi:hypothetical protein
LACHASRGENNIYKEDGCYWCKNLQILLKYDDDDDDDDDTLF